MIEWLFVVCPEVPLPWALVRESPRAGRCGKEHGCPIEVRAGHVLLERRGLCAVLQRGPAGRAARQSFPAL